MTETRLSAYSPKVCVTVAERLFTLHRAASLEELWDAMTQDTHNTAYIDDERLPYWTEVWPAGVALAQWLWQSKAQIQGKTCLDLGCGLGLTALVGQWAGAHVIGMDYEEDALHFAMKNANSNNIAAPLWLVMDWRRPAIKKGSIDVLWGGDIMYERRFVQPVINFLDFVLAEHGYAWIAEPCRSVYDAFRSAVHEKGWGAKRVYETAIDPIYAQPARVKVHVWELRR